MSDNAERNHMIEQMRQIARDIGVDHVPRHEFRRRTKHSERQILLLFGSYNALAEAAGLTTRRFPQGDTPQYSDEELLHEVVRVLRMPESKMTRIYFEQHANVSPSVCERRFGGWIGSLREASKLLGSKEDKELLKRLHEYTDTKVRATPISTDTRDHFISADAQEEPKVGPSRHPTVVQLPVAMETSPNVFGDFMNFRGVQHEPVNEQGVVFLFGMVCKELGYIVESVRASFPDCDAKRKVGDNPTRWQRIRIEFEYLSRTFRSHGHDPDQCDVIVCWKNNWPECPIEVLELSTAVTKLPS